MRVEHGKIEGDLSIYEHFTLHGMITGTLTVKDGGQVMLHGMVSRDLILDPGSKVDLHGTVTGNVLNRGGQLRVFGTINGSIREEGGSTVVEPGAVVGGQRR